MGSTASFLDFFYNFKGNIKFNSDNKLKYYYTNINHI